MVDRFFDSADEVLQDPGFIFNQKNVQKLIERVQGLQTREEVYELLPKLEEFTAVAEQNFKHLPSIYIYGNRRAKVN